MFYYHVFISEISYKSAYPLTYASPNKLAVGTLVNAPIKNKVVPGFIVDRTAKPKFPTKLLQEHIDLDPLPRELASLAQWLINYYATSVGIATAQFLPKQLPKTPLSEPTLQDSTNIIVSPPVTKEQNIVLKNIVAPDTYLLHGQTGSGKTRVYIEIAEKKMKEGRSSLILTPEIGLTPQLAQDFIDRFGEKKVFITHSQLTIKQRRDTWAKILNSTSPLIVIGARSALFSPLKNIGLIVLDEAHEQSYKQDQAPYYQAKTVAAQLASLHSAILVLGSATPLVQDYYFAKQKQKSILRMHNNAKNTPFNEKTDVSVIELKDRSKFTKKQHISDLLIEQIERTINSGEQALIFLNRRGTARNILCDHCDWQAICTHCNLPLTYHGDSHLLRCHTCGKTQKPFLSCPKCSNPTITLKTAGTKAIVEEIQQLFPHAKIQRFDADNKRADRLEQHYQEIKLGKIDILVGTQILAKGLDLPKLSLVGIVIADTGLAFPDFTSQEKTYQMLHQVIGRVGRGHRKGRVIIQTYDAKNLAVAAAANGEWDKFYAQELAERKLFNFPPFCFLLKLTCRRNSAEAAHKAAAKYLDILHNHKVRVIINGPSPSFYEKIGNKYQWQIILKASDRKELIKAISLLPANWTYDIDPSTLI